MSLLTLEACRRGVRTFNGRIIFINEMTLNQLDGEAGFSYASAADDNQLVLSKKLQEHADLVIVH